MNHEIFTTLLFTYIYIYKHCVISIQHIKYMIQPVNRIGPCSQMILFGLECKHEHMRRPLRAKEALWFNCSSLRCSRVSQTWARIFFLGLQAHWGHPQICFRLGQDSFHRLACCIWRGGKQRHHGRMWLLLASAAFSFCFFLAKTSLLL